MSDSDDTDVLLLIPPKFFLVPSDEECPIDDEVQVKDRVLVDNLISQINDLEGRLNVIENFAGSRLETTLDSFEHSHSLPFTDPSASVQETSTNVRNFLQSNLTPPKCSLSLNNNEHLSPRAKAKESAHSKDKQNLLIEIDSYFERIKSHKKDLQLYGVSNMNCGYSILETMLPNGSPTKRLELNEVDKLLKEMEDTQKEIENKLRSRELDYGLGEKSKSIDSQRKSFLSQDEEFSRKAYLMGENIGSVPDLGFGIRDMFVSTPSASPVKGCKERSGSDIPCGEEPFIKRDAYLVGSSSINEDQRRSSGSSIFSKSPRKDLQPKLSLPVDSRKPKGYLSPRRKLQVNNYTSSKQATSLEHKLATSGIDPVENNIRDELMFSGETNEFVSGRTKPEGFSSNYKPRAPLGNQQIRGNLLSLADLWKSETEINLDDPSKLRQKLEEEKYRRLHLENTVQSLNRRVLEEQEKLAVAMRVDEGKDRAIGRITDAWKQMVEHWKEIEAERHSMSQKLIADRSTIKKAQDDINKKIERWEKELSQALDLAAGFKSKCEFLENELAVTKDTYEDKIKRCEENLKTKEDLLKQLQDERQKLAEKLAVSQEEHIEEKKLVEIARQEVNIVQKNLNDIEAELIVVKEQKELLTTRLKEEKGRNQTLDQQKILLQEALSEAKAKQLKAEEDAKAAMDQLDSTKIELRTLYQNQLETVVKDKLAEFQGQLDSAQTAMQAEIESTKRIAQQRAEQEHQALINSHVSEMRRLEAIHKEELRELNLRLVESERRRTRLENGKKDIAQKLHGVMETQWQQALNIITSELSMRQSEPEREVGQGDNKPSSVDSKTKLQEPESEASDDTPFNKDGQVTCRSNHPKTNFPGKQEQLLKYIQMLLDKQPGKPVDTTSSSQLQDTTQSEILDQSLPESLPWHQIINSVSNGPKGTDIQAQMQQLKKPPWK